MPAQVAATSCAEPPAADAATRPPARAPPRRPFRQEILHDRETETPTDRRHREEHQASGKIRARPLLGTVIGRWNSRCKHAVLSRHRTATEEIAVPQTPMHSIVQTSLSDPL